MTRRCARCRSYGPTHRHHLTAKGMGGSPTLERGETVDLCPECHAWVHLYPQAALEEGYRRLRNVG